LALPSRATKPLRKPIDTAIAAFTKKSAFGGICKALDRAYGLYNMPAMVVFLLLKTVPSLAWQRLARFPAFPHSIYIAETFSMPSYVPVGKMNWLFGDMTGYTKRQKGGVEGRV
jgi:hypothetical protein